MRAQSKLASGWWDYTTLDKELLDDAASLDEKAIEGLARQGFSIRMYDTREAFFLAEALEYISAWQQATENNPTGICGPIGPTEQLPLVAQLVNELNISLRNCHFWGMDEWVVDGKDVSLDFPLGFARADMELCFKRIRPELAMPEDNTIQLKIGMDSESKSIQSEMNKQLADMAKNQRALLDAGHSIASVQKINIDAEVIYDAQIED